MDLTTERITDEGEPLLYRANETALLIRADGSLVTVSRVERRDGALSNKVALGLSANPGAPLMQWSRHTLTALNAHGPKLLEVSIAGVTHVLLASREFDSQYAQKTVLGQLTLGSTPSYAELLRLNGSASSYDQGYPGMVWDGQYLWLSHYESQSSGDPVVYPSTVFVSKIQLQRVNGELRATLLSKKPVWTGVDQHGAFTSLALYGGTMWLVFRVGPAHESFRSGCAPGAGKIVLYRSATGEQWTPVRDFSVNVKPSIDWWASSRVLF